MKIEDIITAVEENDQVKVSCAVHEFHGDLLATLQTAVIDGLPIVNYLSKTTNHDPEILKTFLDIGADVSQPSDEGTPIQLACRHGNLSIITMLLDYGAKLDTPEIPVYAEDSPFYIASAQGYEDIVKELYSYQPKLVKDVQVRSCLLYAACLGGNKTIILLWYSPELSINDPPYYATSDISMDRTPLYAACQGGHYEVAKYLYDNFEAELNQKICEQFPDVVDSLLPRCVVECSEDETEDGAPKYSAEFSNKGLGGFHGDWIQQYTDTLVHLDIGHNNIRRLPSAVPWGLPNLVTFCASHNKLTQYSTDPYGAVICARLKEIDLSYNLLEELCDELFQLRSLTNLNLSHNKLTYLVKTHHKLDDWRNLTKAVEKSESESEWQCLRLSVLNVSYNKLNMFPPDIKMCKALVDLDVSHNNLTTFQSPWECKLTRLDLSHNELERFPPSVEQFWCGTLRALRLSDNHLEEINESIVKLCVLQNLDVSHNKIVFLPKQELWDCKQLTTLNLSCNRLGQQMNVSHEIREGEGTCSQKRTSWISKGIKAVELPKIPLQLDSSVMPKIFKRRSAPIQENVSARIQFPALLGNSLTDLNLSNNLLDCIPPSICQLISLQVIDVSRNPGIRCLPRELGRLKQISQLHLNGCGIPEFNMNPADGVDKHSQKTREIMQGLRDDLRQCQKYSKMKLVILGKKDKGKTTLATLLGCKIPDDHQSLGLRRMETQIYSHKKSSLPLPRKSTSGASLTLSVWDLAGDEAYAATHHCFFTSNSLYLLVWDVCSLKKEMDKLGQWLYSIEAGNPNSKIILVGTFLDKLTGSNKASEVSKIKSEILQRYGSTSETYGGLCSILEPENIIFVSCINNKEGISELKKNLCECALNVKVSGSRIRMSQSFVGRSIPHSYILLEKEMEKILQSRLQDGRPPFLVQKEFEDVINGIPGCDIDTSSELIDVVKFLVESGTILHFNDQLKGLNNLYFLDPSWLCDVLSKVLIDPTESRTAIGGKIALSKVMNMYMNDDKFPKDHAPQLIQLLERFEIALMIEGGRKLFIPSWLSKYPAMDLHTQNQTGRKVRRLYQLAFTPNGMWSRLLSRIMGRIELLSNDWVLKQTSKQLSATQFQRTMLRRKSSSQGLILKQKDMIYWEDGMCLRHSSGYFILESVIINGNTATGILITVQSSENEYAILGMIVDAIDDLLSDHYPGLMDFDIMGQPRIQRFAVCPNCYDITGRRLPEIIDHFTVEHCSRLLLTSDTIVCKKGMRVELCDLVPELLFRELPSKFLLDTKKLEVDISHASFLGCGVAGSVFKGRYGVCDVAVKYYHGAPNMTPNPQLVSKDSSYYSGDKNLQSEQAEGSNDDSEDDEDYVNFRQKISVDTDEANSIKAWRAFMEMRQEVDVTSKLQHPAIISFFGICVRPKLLMCLELAPLGSLRNVLDYEIEGRDPFNKYRDKDKIFHSVFNKDITFRFVFQIAKGLEYLHKNYIIYRDLKSDNILVTSLKLDVPVNVKLSDYGISKFNTSGGIVGMVGTPGYQAPEIMEGLAYDEKVDIFSFAMVIYELLSGERPYCEYRNVAQISRAMKVEAKRPSLNDTNIDSRFPMLEKLMCNCWHSDALNRPTASDIVSQEIMRSIQFICQHQIFTTPDNLKHEDIDCVAAVSRSEGGGQRAQLWMWEGSEDNRCCHIIDATLCRYHVYNEKFPGQTVTCMAKVDKEVWIGTENEEIEIYGHSGVGNLSRNKTIGKLGATPTAILYMEKAYQGTGKVYISLHSGKLRIYVPNFKATTTVQNRQVEWRLQKTLQVSKSEATCIVQISELDELWVGCDDHISVVSDKTEMVEQRIKLKHKMQILTYDMREARIHSLIYSDGRVWCLVANSACILEYDAETRFLTHMFHCDEAQPHGMIVSKYVTTQSFGSEPFSDSDTSESSSGARRLSSESEESFNQVTSEDVDMWIEESSTVPDTNANRKTLQFEPSIDKSEDPSQSSSTFPRPSAKPRVPRRLVSYPDIQTPCTVSKTPPPPPPRQPITPDKPKSQTLPPKLSGEHATSCAVIHVNTIKVLDEVLWVGRSCGDILIINVKSNNQFGLHHGQVISCLTSKCLADGGRCEVEELISIGDSLMISLVKEDSKNTSVIAWEAYTAKKVQEVRTYWSLKDKEERVQKSQTLTRFLPNRQMADSTVTEDDDI